MSVIVSSEILLIFLSRFSAYFYCNFYVAVKFNIELYISYYLFYYDFLIYNRDKTTRYSGRDFQGGPTRLSQKRIPTRNVFAALTFLSSQKIPGFNTRLIFCIMKYKKKAPVLKTLERSCNHSIRHGSFSVGLSEEEDYCLKSSRY